MYARSCTWWWGSWWARLPCPLSWSTLSTSASMTVCGLILETQEGEGLFAPRTVSEPLISYRTNVRTSLDYQGQVLRTQDIVGHLPVWSHRASHLHLQGMPAKARGWVWNWNPDEGAVKPCPLCLTWGRESDAGGEGSFPFCSMMLWGLTPLGHDGGARPSHR